jgi:PKD domain
LPAAAASLIAAALAAVLMVPSAGAAPAAVSASFTVTPKAPLSLWPVTFTSTSSATGNGNAIASQTWDLDGNGTFEGPQAPTASRSFPVPGAFQVGLRVVDTKGHSSVAVATVQVGNRRPIASIARFPDEPHTGEPVTFFSTSIDQDGAIGSQAWDLDSDGKFDDGKNTLASRAFTTAGVYTVRMQVADNSGASHEATHTFAVTDPPPALTASQAGPARLMSPFPIVRLAGDVRRRGIRVRLLTVQAPVRAKVKITCRGSGCPFRSRSRTVGASKRDASPLRFRQFRTRLLRPGASVQVFVTSRNAIGKYTRFSVRRGKPPSRRDRCLAPGRTAPMTCPGGG